MKPLVGQDRKKWIVFSASHHLFWGCSYSSFSLPSSLCREPWRGAVGKQRVKEDHEFSCASGTRIVPASASSSSHITFGMLPEDGQVRSPPICVCPSIQVPFCSCSHGIPLLHPHWGSLWPLGALIGVLWVPQEYTPHHPPSRKAASWDPLSPHIPV